MAQCKAKSPTTSNIKPQNGGTTQAGASPPSTGFSVEELQVILMALEAGEWVGRHTRDVVATVEDRLKAELQRLTTGKNSEP